MRQILLLTFILFNSFINGQTLKDHWTQCNNKGCQLLDPYYSEGVTMEWSGTCIEGKADGFGILKKYYKGEWESTYEGEFKNGISEGKGKFTHKGGTILECNFINGQAIGKGRYDLGDGNSYEGEIINYRSHGFGVLKQANGAFFEGFFVSDKPYTGKWTNYDGKISYIQQMYPIKVINEKQSGYNPEIGKRVTEYFDENWNHCKQKEASYYRLVTYQAPNKPIGIIKDYFISGQLQSEFTCVYLDYNDDGKNFHEGEATWYHKNGKIEQKRYYYNNKINGPNIFYYENGQISQERHYNHGVLDGYLKSYYPNGNPSIIANYVSGNLLNQKYIEYDENGLGALVYNEPFFLNEEKWTSNQETYQSSVNFDGQLELKLTSDIGTQQTNYIAIDANSDYSIETTIHRKNGDDGYAYGLFFGFKDWNNYFHFAISDFGSYKIFGKFEGIDINLTDWKKSAEINTTSKRNQLKVLKLGEEFIFSINGTIVERIESKSLRGNNYGMLVYGKGTYVMENLIIKEFLSNEVAENNQPENTESNSNEWKGNGSGFFISSKGYIATNYHVIEGASVIQVEFFQKGVKNIYNAKVIVSDKQNDLAIIQINNPDFKNLPSIPYVFSTNIKDVGTEVFALGYPMANVMGNEIKFTDGKISSKTGIDGDITVYQISVPIQPGNSGGPLFDSKGNLVGLTSSALNKEYFNSENVNYAIKTSYLKSLIDVLPENIILPNNIEIYNKPLTEKIKLLSDFIPLIRVK